MANETEIERMVVRLIGDSQSYVKMMKEAEVQAAKTAEVIKDHSKTIENMGESLKSFGAKMSLFVSAPLAAIGALATKEFGDYEAALSRLVGVVGLGEDEVAEFSKVVKELSVETGKAPLELVNALENITSSGIRGKDALEALTQTTRAAVGGLGEIRGVSSAVTAAMNAYGSDVLSATKATDILTQAVLEGSAEASEFAPVMGQVMPYAKELGVTFDQAAGSIAFLTRTTGNASLAATQVKGLLNSILRMKDEGNAAEALAEIGLNADMIRKTVAEKGLLPALTMLRKKADEAGVSMSKFFTDGEALLAALQMSGDASEIAAGVLDRVKDSAGAADRAFEAFSKTMKFRMNLVMAETKVLLLDLGETLSGVMDFSISGMQYAISVWKGLSEEVKLVIVILGSVLAAIGPIITALGIFLIAAAKVWAVIALIGPAFAIAVTAAGGLIPITIALGVMAIKLAIIANTFMGVYKIASSVVEKMTGMNEELEVALATSRKLDGLQADKTTKSQGNILAQAEGMQGADKKSFLEQELSMAEKNAKGYEVAVAGAAAEVEKLSTLWNTTTGNKVLEVAKQDLVELQDKSKNASEFVGKLREELGGLPAEAAANVAGGGVSAKPIDPKVQEDVDKLTASMKLQAETVGMSAREVEIYKLKQQGASTMVLRALAIQERATEKNRELAASIKTFTEGLELQAATMHMSSSEAEIYKLTQQGATEEQLKSARAAAELVKVGEKHKSMLEKAKALTEQYTSSEDKFKKGKTELREMLDSGEISLDTYSKALDDLQKQTQKDYSVDLTPKGVEAIAAGSAEAMYALEEYKNLMMEPMKPDISDVMPRIDEAANTPQFIAETEKQHYEEPSTPQYDAVDSVKSMMRQEGGMNSDTMLENIQAIRVASEITSKKDPVLLAGADL